MLADRSIATSTGTLRLTESDGTGLPVVMLHGSGSSRAAFGHQLNSDLARRYRLIALDLPGHGDSDDAADPADYRLSRLAEIVEEVIVALRLRRFALLGWSLGGHIAMHMLDRPGLAGAMVVGAPPLPRSRLGMLWAFRPSLDLLLASKAQFSVRDVQRFGQLCFPQGATPDLMRAIIRSDGRCRAAVLQSMLHEDSVDQRQAVEDSRVPVALVNGENEPFTRLGYLDGLARQHLWRGAPLVVANAGHAPFWDQPATFNRLFGLFAADISKAGMSDAVPVRRRA